MEQRADPSPVREFLAALDKLDLDAATALLATDCRVLMADGQRSEGRPGIRSILQRLLGGLRATSHTITAEWQFGDMWVAEVDASYEMRDWLYLDHLPRAFFVQRGRDGISDIRVYGAHEQPLTARRGDDDHARIGGRWWLPL